MFLAQDTAAAGFGLIGVVVGVALIFLAVVWALFPFIVNGKMNSLIREARETNRLLKYAAEKTGNEENVQRRTPNAQSRMAEKKAEEKADVQKHVPPERQEVYRID